MSILHHHNIKSMPKRDALDSHVSQRVTSGAVAPLGIRVNSSTPYPHNQAQNTRPEHISKVIHRYALQSEARRLLMADFESGDPIVPTRGERKQLAHRTTLCCRAILPDRHAVDLLHYPDKKSGGFGGLVHCSSVWTCPVCGAKISERRRESLIAALAMVSNPTIMVTLTIQHKRGDALVMLRDVLLRAYDKLLTTGKAAAGFNARWCVIGRARAVEATYGKNGWHIHAHVALMLGVPLADFDADAFQTEARKRWSDILNRMGGYASYQHGLTVTVSADPSYLAKLGFETVTIIKRGGRWSIESEMTKAPTKEAKYSGLTPQMLLAASMVGGHVGDDFSLGGTEAGRLWLEYAAAMFRQQQLVTSGKIRELIKLVGGDKTDEQIEQEETETALILGRLSKRQWLIILGNDARGELSEVLATGDTETVAGFLRDFDIEMLPATEPEPEQWQGTHIDLDTMQVTDLGRLSPEAMKQAALADKAAGRMVSIQERE